MGFQNAFVTDRFPKINAAGIINKSTINKTDVRIVLYLRVTDALSKSDEKNIPLPSKRFSVITGVMKAAAVEMISQLPKSSLLRKWTIIGRVIMPLERIKNWKSNPNPAFLKTAF